ncbi:protein shisa-5-like [Cyprinus carpio]|uniref:Protein shisa-5-like n=1 Tax=Cyprinus carpio TaxID=7962 RepID=A0A9R0AVM8_CYPCA|nr:protein shisa-5-like [Cyprinus carpio]
MSVFNLEIYLSNVSGVVSVEVLSFPFLATQSISYRETLVLPLAYQLRGFVVLIILFICCCCCCPCCCIYRMCRKPRPVVQTHVTTVMNTQCIQQQPVMQGVQYPQYQPMPTQPGYGGHPMQTGPYQGQSYASGPPPPYHVTTSPGYPTIQGAYDGGQAMYPMQPPAQPAKLS